MKVMKNVTHLTFGDLIVGDTYLNSDGSPRMKVAQSVASKLEAPDVNMVDLESGIMYVVKKDEGVSKVELGITGMFARDEFGS